MWKTRSLIGCVVSLAVLCASGAPARADLFGFEVIEPQSSVGPVAAQLSLEVTDSAGYVYFTFLNNLAPGPVVPSPLTSSITHVYFDDRAGVLDSLVALIGGPGVSFGAPATPGNLPGGNNLTPDFYGDFSVGAASGNGGVAANGVNPGEYLQIRFSRRSSFDDLLAALHAGAGDPTGDTGTLRVGIHVQQLVDAAGRQTSDKFVLTPTAQVPLPGSVLLGMLGLSAVGVGLRRLA